MSSLDSLRERLAGLSIATKVAVEEHRVAEAAERAARQKEKVRRRVLAAAAGITGINGKGGTGGAEVETSVQELVDFLKLRSETEQSLRMARRAEAGELASELEAALAEIDREVASRSGGEDEFLKFLAEIQLAGAGESPTNGALLSFASRAKEMGLVGTLPEMEARDRLRRLHEARESGERLSPEQVRFVWIIPNPRENSHECYITVWCDAASERTRVARIRSFAWYYAKLFRAVKDAGTERRAEFADLEARVNLAVEEMFKSGTEGFVKLSGITSGTPWAFHRADGAEGKVWGAIYAEVDCGRITLVLPERSPLRRTCEILGLVDSDRSGKKFAFDPNFEGLRALNGPPIPFNKIAQARAFLCLAAGIQPPRDEDSEEERSPAATPLPADRSFKNGRNDGGRRDNRDYRHERRF